MNFVNKITLVVIGMVCLGILSCGKNDDTSVPRDVEKIDYLAFQLFVSGSTEPQGDYSALRSFISEQQIESFFQLVVNKVGRSSVSNRRSAVMIGPIALDFSGDQISALIDFAFDMAIKYDVAVGFHIDDGMFWARRIDLWQNPENVEWLNWEQRLNESRYVDWVQTRLAPQMCFNCPKVMEAVSDFMANIGTAIMTNHRMLEDKDREDLYAGTIVGWETSLDKDRDTELSSGYHAMTNLGYGPSNPPEDMDALRVQIVKDYIHLMAEPLDRLGHPVDKTYSHIAFLSKKLYQLYAQINPVFGAQSYEEVNGFSPPEIAFGSNIKAGFSTYYTEERFDEIYALENENISGWACAEGTNIILGMPPMQTGFSMESYLARHFNYGATLVNIFAFNIPAVDAFNRVLNEASEGEEAIAAYKKFLRGESLIE